MRYHFRFYKEDDGYNGECIELKGCRSEGDNPEELKINLTEALDLYLDEPPGSNLIFPPPCNELETEKDILSIPVDPSIAFALLVRQYRISRRMTQKEAQQALNLPNRTSYTRLEKKGNPRLNTIVRLLEAFPDFPISECLKR